MRPNEHKDNLVTERDIDMDFGLFQEDSYPDALPDQDKKAAVEHAIPKEKASESQK